jgi:hypothetical protein
MSIEAVIQYWDRVGVSENEDGARVAEKAGSAGFAFTAAELKTALEVRELLDTVRQDQALRDQLRSAKAPLSALVDTARQSGFDLDADAILSVIRALRSRQGELNAGQLDRVAGGTRFCLPEADDEVLVAFAHGDPETPFLVGSLWNPKDTPPTGR